MCEVCGLLALNPLRMKGKVYCRFEHLLQAVKEGVAR